ncbi:cell division initiation protein [Aerococcus sp. 150760007-1]|uniref:DivIVA domain-containing protein n=1 Tax=Aerococcus urinaeequi TaxID=51665 RepID=A0ABR5ZW17_9LACT|nr:MULTISPECIES: DivIVA domain-containing protein [Lactobacillales]KAF3302560.1 DivIVA domain-containing protein [Carnobacterium sp. PL17RED31]KAF3305285.1 DivIVA domain-containing protein [Carnobacterium sp. PL17GRE32]MBA5745933.1 DivIVA domain-containing protein [Aerococcus urinaeequi]MBA5828718.1 DivIVA domain-containing protein [Aerococcus urinaeequi]MBA5859621.1 DivIVA domain-containing protein [Aerococcus urinaeequi]
MRASEIKNMKFKQKISGYGKTEVDDYLNKVRVSMQKLEDQNKSLQDQLNEANKEVDAAHRKEATVNRSIFVAQEAADRLREEALNEASLIVESAEEEARRLLAEAAEKAAVINTETDNLQEAARTYLHQSFGMILQAKDMYEDPRWENLFFEKPVGDVPTPQLDEVVKDYDLPVRSNKGEAIFEAAAEKAEKEQRKEEFFNNDIPAIAPVFSGFKDSEPVVEEAETSAVAENASESVETASSENTGSENTPDAAEETQVVAAETTDQTDTNQPTTDAEDVTDELVQSESTEADLTNAADKSEE